jgi:hypothetical protein
MLTSSRSREELPPLGTTSSSTAVLLAQIRAENTQKLSQMSVQEIEALQREIYTTLDPTVIQMLKKRGQQQQHSQHSQQQPQQRVSSTLKSDRDHTSHPLSTPSVFESSSSQLFSLVERLNVEKMRWLQDVSESESAFECGSNERENTNTTINNNNNNNTKAITTTNNVSEYRYDFTGQRIVEDSYEGMKIPVSSGLYHHGEAAHKPGYTLRELHHLLSSAVPAQRSLALKTLTAIWRRVAMCCEATTLAEALALRAERENILTHAVNLRFPLLIRHLLDDTARPVLELALDALHALLCATTTTTITPDEDDTLYTLMHTVWPHAVAGLYPLHPTSSNPSSSGVRTHSATPLSDFERMQHDLVKGLLRTGLLVRLRYLLEVVPDILSVATRIKICEVLTRIARHSSSTLHHHMLKVNMFSSQI